MKSNLLISKIHLIQREYKELLKRLLPKLKNSLAPAALDEISLFWWRHSEEIQLYLRYWFPGENSYVFTAAAYMSFENKDHLPFLLLGDKHVVDDPLGKYAEIQLDIANDKFAETLYNQIGETAENNLLLLENINEDILVLPLRILNQTTDNGDLITTGGAAFVSLFDGIDNVEEYFLKCSTIDDIIHFARNDIDSLILFSEEDDVSLTFEERFREAKAKLRHMLDDTKTDSEIFFRIVYGYIQQAIDVVSSCVLYRCIPSISNRVSLHYILLLTEGLKDIEHINTLRFRMGVAFAVYRFCDNDILGAAHFQNFLRINKEYKFGERLFLALNKSGVNEKAFSGQLIADIVNEQLKKLYEIVLSDNNCME